MRAFYVCVVRVSACTSSYCVISNDNWDLGLVCFGRLLISLCGHCCLFTQQWGILLLLLGVKLGGESRINKRGGGLLGKKGGDQ